MACNKRASAPVLLEINTRGDAMRIELPSGANPGPLPIGWVLNLGPSRDGRIRMRRSFGLGQITPVQFGRMLLSALILTLLSEHAYPQGIRALPSSTLQSILAGHLLTPPAASAQADPAPARWNRLCRAQAVSGTSAHEPLMADGPSPYLSLLRRSWNGE